MTVSSETAKSGPYSGNGATTVFAYGFRILDASHIEVVRTIDGTDSTVSPSEYTVSGVGDLGGGNVTFTIAPVAGQSITIIRNAPFTQQTDLENQGAYYAETIEEALDLAAMRDQQLAEELTRAVKLPVGENASVLPGLIEGVIKLTDSVGVIETVAGIASDVTTVAGLTAEIAALPGQVTDAQAAVSAIDGDADRAEAAAAQAALYDGPWLDTVTALLADTTLTYTAGTGGSIAAGDIVRTRAEGFSYEVADSAAVDHHITTAGGVKLYVRPFPCAFETRTAFLAAIAAGYVWADGTVVTAGNQSYRKDGSTDIYDLPGWTWHGEETFWHHGGDYGDPDLPSSVSIRHVRDGTYVYDVIEIKNPRPQTLRKEFAPGVAVDGVVDRIAVREYAQLRGYQSVINCDGWRNADGTPGFDNVSARPMGLQIADGVLFQDWLAPETRDQAIVMTAQGRLVRADKAGPTGAQWVAQNARWSAHFGVCVVEGGVAQNVDATYVTAAVSARVVLGQKSNGDLVIIMIEGITGSYGASGTQAGVIAQALGCEIAYLLDGGGSVQAWWRDCYAMPSSDDAFESERDVPTFLVIDAPVPEYDTGWITVPAAGGVTAQIAGWPILSVRQRGAQVDMHVNAAASFITTNFTAISNGFPDRFRSADKAAGMARGALVGPGGILGSAFMGTSISGRASTAASSYLMGTVSWPSMHSGLPHQNA